MREQWIHHHIHYRQNLLLVLRHRRNSGAWVADISRALGPRLRGALRPGATATDDWARSQRLEGRGRSPAVRTRARP